MGKPENNKKSNLKLHRYSYRNQHRAHKTKYFSGVHVPEPTQDRLEYFLAISGGVLVSALCIGVPAFLLSLYDSSANIESFLFYLFFTALYIWIPFIAGFSLTEKAIFKVDKVGLNFREHWNVPTGLWEALNLKDVKNHIPNSMLDMAREYLPAAINAAEFLDWAYENQVAKTDETVISAQKTLQIGESLLKGLNDARLESLKHSKNFKIEKERPESLGVDFMQNLVDEQIALLETWKQTLNGTPNIDKLSQTRL